MSKKEKEKVEVMKINDSKFTINIDEKPDRAKPKEDAVKVKTLKASHKNKEEEDDDKDEEKDLEKDLEKDVKKDTDIPELDYENDEIESKRKRLMIIARYKSSKRFGNWLKTQGFEFNTKSLKNKSLDELENMINDIRFCISTKNTNNMYETGATKGVLILENMVRPVYKVDGLSQVLSNDPMYLDLIEELLLERANYVYVKPEYRLLYCVLSSAYIIHAQHIALEKLSQTEEGKKMIRDFANKIENETPTKTDQATKDLDVDKILKEATNKVREENRKKEEFMGLVQPTQTKHITTRTPMDGTIEKKQVDTKYYEKYKELLTG